MKIGKFIVFEGIDGCGKSTQIKRASDYIQHLDKYHEIARLREPTKRARTIITELNKSDNPYSERELLTQAFIQERVEHTSSTIIPLINNGIHVLCDRYSMSTCAYQSAQGESIDSLVSAHQKHISQRNICVPNATFLIDVSEEITLERISSGRESKEKFEQIDFLKKVRNNYLSFTRKESRQPNIFGRIYLIDGNKSIEEVASKINEILKTIYS